VIRVNLLGTLVGAPVKRQWVPAAQRSALIGVGMIVLTAVAVSGWWYYLYAQGGSLTSRIGTAEIELVRLQEAAKLVAKATARKAELSERLALIDRLRASKRGPVSLLETLNRSIPDGLWLLEIKQTGTAVQVDGRALSLSSVTDFAERLQNSGLFEHPVEILTTLTEAVEETTVVRFSVKAEAAKPVQPTGGTTAAVPGAPAAAAVPGAKGA
jgi:type IV pilus assembly protein PilN